MEDNMDKFFTRSVNVRKRLLLLLFLLIVCTLVVYVYAKQSTTPVASKSLTNIQEAYTAEINAHFAYLAYARKADEEGYKKAGSLFRALATAEQIHASRHANILKDIGVTPEENTIAPVVKTTKENLQAAYDDEIYDSQTKYPNDSKQASKDKISKAPHDFSIISKAEGVHAKLLKQMMDDYASNWTGQKDIYYVCPTCGNILKDRPLACPICFTSGKKFIKVS
jgi:rubrerythrin